MKFMVVFTCALAAASAGIIAPIGSLVVAGPQHLPVIGPNGVPIDTPAVQQARAAHLSHKVEAHARNGDLSLVAHAAPLIAHGGTLAYAHQHAITTPIVAAHAAHGIVAHVGIPETAEVVAAKQVHFAAHAEALARNGLIAPIHHILRRGILAIAAPQHLPVIGVNGVPVDTIEVQQARAAHLVHKVEAHARNGDLSLIAQATPLSLAHSGISAPAWTQTAVAAPLAVARALPAAWATTLGLPAITANGIPLETPEVVAAKSNHFAAHAEALTRNSPIISEVVVAAPLANVW